MTANPLPPDRARLGEALFPPQAPARPLIVGYGNPLRGDDGVGWHVAAQLYPRLAGQANVQTHHQLTPDMAADWSTASAVLLVDARVGAPPGRIVRRVITPQARPASAFSHHVDAVLLAGLTAALFGRCPPVTLYTINGANFDLSETLSPAVQAAAARLVNRLTRQVRRAQAG